MEYFIKSLPVILIAAAIVAISAVLYFVSLQKSAEMKRKRAKEKLKKKD